MGSDPITELLHSWLQPLEILDQVMLGQARVYVIEPSDFRLDQFVGGDRDPVAIVEAGAPVQPGQRFVNHGVIEMQPDVGVNIKREVQHSGPFIDAHCGTILAVYLDLFIIGVAGVDPVDIRDEEI